MAQARSDDAVKVWGHTQAKVVECSYVWTLNNYSFYQGDEKECITSPTFSASLYDDIKWCIKLDRFQQIDNDYFNSKTTYISLNLVLVCNQNNLIQKDMYLRAKYTLSILNRDGEKKHESILKVIKLTKDMKYERWYSINESDLYWYIKDNNDALTISCDVSVISKPVNISISNTIQIAVPECRLADDIAMLFANKELFDVTLTVAGKEFQAHKAILAARSSVFAAMFKHEMAEKKFNRVDIIDVNDKVFLEMLRFIYTGEVKNLETIAADLLVAADKYALDRLKVMCEKVLCTNLSIANAAKLLQLADRHGAAHLKSQASLFIKTHATGLLDTLGRNSAKSTPFILAFQDLELYSESAVD